MALFGEKYGDEVRVISVGDWARELCGGTHAGRSGQLGVVKLLGESSIGSGVRRVEALVGGDAYRFLAREHVLVAQLSEALKARPEELPERVDDIVERLRAAEKEIEQVARRSSCSPRPAQLAADAEDVYGVASSATAPTARAAATCARSRSTSAAGCPQRPSRRGRVIGSERRQARGRRGGQRRGPRAGGLSANALVRRPRRRSAAAAAARTTSPRAAAPTRHGRPGARRGRARGRPRAASDERR